jgi:hypothetical protein
MAKSYRKTPKRRTRAGWPSRGFYSKAHWRYYFATRPKAVARKIARATPGGKGAATVTCQRAGLAATSG